MINSVQRQWPCALPVVIIALYQAGNPHTPSKKRRKIKTDEGTTKMEEDSTTDAEQSESEAKEKRPKPQPTHVSDRMSIVTVS